MSKATGIALLLIGSLSGGTAFYLFLRHSKTAGEVANWQEDRDWLTAHANGQGEWQLHPKRAPWWWDGKLAQKLAQERLGIA